MRAPPSPRASRDALARGRRAHAPQSLTALAAALLVLAAGCERGSPSQGAGSRTYTLVANGSGTGSGTITSVPSGISCAVAGASASGSCSRDYDPGTRVTLTATPAARSAFGGWAGACTGAGSCQMTMSTARSVTAAFNALPSQFSLAVTRDGRGSGTITSSPAGIDCGTACSAPFDSATVVTLTAVSATGSVFAGWGGACTGAGTCQVTMAEAASVTATWDMQQFMLTIAPAGSGSGTVTSSPDGLSCGSACSVAFDTGTVVTLTATPGSGSLFGGWGGACSGTGTCQVTMSRARSVTVNWGLQQFTLTVTKAGTGSGSVISSPNGLSCGAACGVQFDANTVVTLTANPAAGSMFAGWSGACSGTGSCQVTMSQARTVTARFDPAPPSPFALTVSLAGAGSGTVASTPAGIACGGGGSACSASFDSGTVVTLAATPDAGSAFAGWSGACSGTGGCQVTMSRARSVTAAFTPSQASEFPLQIVQSGAGSGTISMSVNGVECTGGCPTSFGSGTVVTLTAAPSIGSEFAGWTGPCSGTGPCQVTMSQPRTVTATFNIIYYRFTVRGGGTGSGMVTSSPGGINCTFIHGTAGSGCSGVFPYGTTVTLNPVAYDGNSFAGWSGVCFGTGSCQISVPRDTATRAAFTLLSPVTPTGLVVVSRTANSVVLAWRRVPEVDLYYLLRSPVAGGTYVTVYSGRDTTFTDADLASSTDYFYEVRAYNNAGWSTFSTELHTTTSPGVPSIPTSLAIGGATGTSLQISWTGVSQATGYQLLRATSATGTYTEVYKGAGTSVTNPGLAGGTTYWYEVKAFNGYGYGAAAGPASGTTLAGSPPDAPAWLVVNDPTATSLHVSWSASAGATGYELLRSESAAGPYEVVYHGDGRGVTDSLLASRSTYYYKVRAFNAYGAGDLSDYRSGATLAVTAYETAYLKAVFGRGGFTWITNVPKWQTGTIWIRYGGYFGHHIGSPAWSRCYDAVLVLEPHDNDRGGSSARDAHGDHDGDGRSGSSFDRGRGDDDHGDSHADRGGRDEDEWPSFFFSEHAPRRDMGLDLDPATTSVTVAITGVLEHRGPHDPPGVFWARGRGDGPGNGRFDFDSPRGDCQTLTRTIPVEAFSWQSPFRVAIGYWWADQRFRYWGAGIREVTLTFNGWLVPEGHEETQWRCTGPFNRAGDRDHAYPRGDRDRVCEFRR
jgi:hypothetical protein